MRLLAIADPHCAAGSPGDSSAPAEYRHGRELVLRAVREAGRRGGVDLVVLLGDLLYDGDAPGAGSCLEDIAELLRSSLPGVRVLAAAGNHDGAAAAAFERYGWESGPCNAGGYRFYVFRDPFGAGDSCTRTDSELASFAEFASRGEGPLIAVQHNPIVPLIEDEYPYNHTNREAILALYERCGVLLSISGHYHDGVPIEACGGCRYLTVPSLAFPRLACALIDLDGDGVDVTAIDLHVDCAPGLVDTHCHTEFAYCGRGISADAAIERARMFGLAGVCLVEHAPQLYVAPDDFWHARHVRVPGLWRKSPSARMEAYLREMCGRRSDYVRVGLEVEADVNGELILQPEHRAQVDLLVGAVHFLPKDDLGGRAANFDGVFLDANRKLLAHDVDILAHPTRMYGRRGHGLSDRVRHELVEMLVQTRTAAEINFHVQEPDREFFQLCVESGVKLAVASDAHVPEDMADLLPHVSFLKTLASGRPVEDLLWRFPCL